MRAMTIPHFGPAELFTLREVPAPEPDAGQVAVRVAWAGVNPVDHKMRDGSSKWVAGFGPERFPLVLGREFSGVVESVGAGVNLSPGTPVFGVADACYAETVVAGMDAVAEMPAGGDPQVFAGLALAGLTAWAAVADAQVTSSDVVLVHGGGGGVGQVAVQLARRAGAEVWATASVRHHDKLRRWGVHPIDYTREDFTQVCPKPTVVIDGVWFGTVERSLAMLQAGDRLVVLPTLADLTAAREAGVEASIPSAAPVPGRLAELARLVASGELEIEVGAVFPLEQVAAAHRLVEGGHAPGKVVLQVASATRS